MSASRSPAIFLGDLDLVAVALQPVGDDVLVGLGVVVHRARRQAAASGARDARLGVDDDVVRYESFAHRGRERQQRGLRVAPRIGDERRRLDRLAVQLRQTVHGVPEQLGGGMLGAVRLLKRGRRVQPEVGRDVDTPGAVTDYGR